MTTETTIVSYRDRQPAQANEVLPPGERFVAAFPARGGFLVGLTMRYRVVVVSDRNVHLYTAAWFSICKPKRLVATMPIGAPLESQRELNYHILHIAGERLWVPWAHWKEMREAIDAWRQIASSLFERTPTPPPLM